MSAEVALAQDPKAEILPEAVSPVAAALPASVVAAAEVDQKDQKSKPPPPAPKKSTRKQMADSGSVTELYGGLGVWEPKKRAKAGAPVVAVAAPIGFSVNPGWYTNRRKKQYTCPRVLVVGRGRKSGAITIGKTEYAPDQMVGMDDKRETDPNLIYTWRSSSWTDAFDEFKGYFTMVHVTLQDSKEWTSESMDAVRFLLKDGGALTLPTNLSTHVEAMMRADEFESAEVAGDAEYTAYIFDAKVSAAAAVDSGAAAAALSS